MLVALSTGVRVVPANFEKFLAAVRDVRPVRVPDLLAVLGESRLDAADEPVELLGEEVRSLALPIRAHVATDCDRVRLLVHLDQLRDPVLLGHAVVVDKRDDLTGRQLRAPRPAVGYP